MASRLGRFQLLCDSGFDFIGWVRLSEVLSILEILECRRPAKRSCVYVGLRHSVCWDFFEFYLESDLLLYLSYSVSVLHCISLILYMFHSQTSMTASFPFH